MIDGNSASLLMAESIILTQTPILFNQISLLFFNTIIWLNHSNYLNLFDIISQIVLFEKKIILSNNIEICVNN
jgi:hypothetical protein